MTEVEKPMTYELNAKRQDRADNWTPDDAIYQASLDIKKFPCTGALVIGWHSEGLNMHYIVYGKDARLLNSLGAELAHALIGGLQT